MTYQQAWEELKQSLLTRGELFFFGGHKAAERTIEYTLKSMSEIESRITKLRLVDHEAADEPK